MNCCPAKIKREIFIKYICGYTPKELADEFGIHFTTIYRWIEGWKKDLPRHTMKELPLQDIGTILEYTENLKHRLDDAERSLAIIHESSVLQTVPLKERITIAKNLIEIYPVKFLCDTFEIPMSTLYYYKRKTRNETKRQQEERDLSDAIRSVFEESKGRLGAERIRVLLQQQGITTSSRRIRKLTKQMKLSNDAKEPVYYAPAYTVNIEEGVDVKIL